MSKWAGKWSQDHDSKTWIVIWSLNCVFAAKSFPTFVIINTQTTTIYFFQHQLLCMVYCRSYLIKNSLTLVQDVQQKFRIWMQNQTFLISDHQRFGSGSGSGSGSGGSGTFLEQLEAEAEALLKDWVEAEAEAIFNSDIKLEAEAEAVLFVFNENGSGSGFFINLEAVVEAAKKCGSGLVF